MTLENLYKHMKKNISEHFKTLKKSGKKYPKILPRQVYGAYMYWTGVVEGKQLNQNEKDAVKEILALHSKLEHTINLYNIERKK